MEKQVKQAGFWSALLVTIFTGWFMVAFGPYMARLKWTNIEEFVANFREGPYLAWVIPCLFLALTFPILTSAIFFSSKNGEKFWSFIGLIFAIMYGAVLSTNYWLLATVVRGAIIDGNIQGLSWLVIGSPFSITNTIEGIGYGFMGLSTLFTGLALRGWTKRVWIVNGLSGLMGVVLGGMGSVGATMVSLVLWCLTFPIATAMMTGHFLRAKA